MSPVLAACLWVLVASVIALIPSRRNHWPQAYVLIATAVPLVAWIGYVHGILAGLVATMAGASILRWPVRYLLAWVRRVVGRGA